jgi:carbamoyltransferase
MKILGICHDVLICSAAVVVDGEVMAAVPEERLDRQKQSRVFPTLASRWCMKTAGVDWKDLDAVAVAWNPSIELETIPGGYLSSRRWRTEHLEQLPARVMQLVGGRATDEMTISGAATGAPPIVFVNHYDAHIGNAFLLSPFDEAAILILDGRGERQTAQFARGKGAHVEKLGETRFPHSLGLVYGAMTQFLGFKPDGDEWKVMALGSFAPGKNRFTEAVRNLIRVDDDGNLHVALEYFEFYNFFDKRMFSDKFVATFGAPRSQSEPLSQKHEELAAAMQLVFEEVVIAVLHALHKKTGLKKLVASGGCFMNSVFNGKITSNTPFTDVFITSCPDDSGTSIGAALWLEAQRTGKRRVAPLLHNSWGPESTDAECLEVAKKFKVPNHATVADPSGSAARDLADGKIVGWFQGKMEFGQRALGNRSILLDPRRKDGKDVVNAAVKFRESFRPFAPAILAERVADWFECPPGTKVPFMEQVFMFKPAQRERVPSVVHVDGSGRLQTVDEHAHPRYRALIRGFEELTGVPIVLNTSFNLNGEPVVCSPEDALRTFFTCALDVLYLGNVRITKST